MHTITISKCAIEAPIFEEIVAHPHAPEILDRTEPTTQFVVASSISIPSRIDDIQTSLLYTYASNITLFNDHRTIRNANTQ